MENKALYNESDVVKFMDRYIKAHYAAVRFFGGESMREDIDALIQYQRNVPKSIREKLPIRDKSILESLLKS